MPTYEYKCRKCKKTFEAFQRISDAPLTACEKCGAKGTVSRLVSRGTGLIFKGSGFYVTDYKRSGSAGTKSESSSKAPEKKEKSEAKDSTKAASADVKKP